MPVAQIQTGAGNGAVAFIKLSVAVGIDKDAADQNLAARKNSGRYKDGGPRLRTLNLLSGGKRRGSDGQIFLLTFAGICAHAYAIQEPRSRAMRDFADAKQQIIALDFRFDRLLGRSADAQQGRSVGVMKRRRQSIFDDHVV